MQHELLSNNSPPCIDRDLHAADFLVDVFHKLDDEINQLVLPELFQVRVGDEEADIEPLVNAHNTYLHREKRKLGVGICTEVVSWATGIVASVGIATSLPPELSPYSDGWTR